MQLSDTAPLRPRTETVVEPQGTETTRTTRTTEATTTVPATTTRTTTTTTTRSDMSMQEINQQRRETPWEIMVDGFGFAPEEFDRFDSSIRGSVGYYFTEVFELGVRQAAAFGDAPGVPDAWLMDSRIFADLHFPLGVVVPFIGGNAGYRFGDAVDDTLVLAPEGGVKIYLQDDAFLVASAEWAFLFETSDSIEDAFDEGLVTVSLGIGLRL